MGLFKASQVILMGIKSWQPLDYRQMLHICDNDDEN